jgi:hypothetical protein
LNDRQNGSLSSRSWVGFDPVEGEANRRSAEEGSNVMGNRKEMGNGLRDWFHPSRRKAREINVANQ